MKNKIKVQCPAKINLDLKVFKKDETTGFHPIKSIMQAINLFDYITIEIENSEKIEIFLDGNSEKIPYDEKNICFKAAKLFLEETNKKAKVNIYIEKNIPVCAGLAGGSTDASGVLVGLNQIYQNILSKEKLHILASKLGSDLNFCLEGGKKLCSSRGEKMEEIEFSDFDLCLVKPKNLAISAKEAYEAFDSLKEEQKSNMKNDLEFALLKKNKYEELKYLSDLGLQMSGSGPTYFILHKTLHKKFDEENFEIFEGLSAIPYGVRVL